MARSIYLPPGQHFQHRLDKKVDGPHGRLGRSGQERTLVEILMAVTMKRTFFCIVAHGSSIRTTHKEDRTFQEKGFCPCLTSILGRSAHMETFRDDIVL